MKILGYMIRTRSCKSNHQCLIDLFSTQRTTCFNRSCFEKPSNEIKTNMISHSISEQTIENHFYIRFIFILLCFPLCIFYYLYELDFKMYALIIYILSEYNKFYEIKSQRININ